MRYFDFTKEDEVEFLKLTEKGLTAVFLYTDKVVHNGERKTLTSEGKSAKIIAFSGKMYAPVSFFTDFLGAKADATDGKITLTLEEKSVSVSEIAKGGYLPIETVANALGIETRLLYEDSFLVMGNKEALDTLTASQELIKAGPYALFGDYDTSAFTDEDYEMAAQRFCDMLVGTKTSNDVTNPIVKQKIDTVNAKCKEALETLNSGDDPAILWGQKLLRDTEDGAAQYNKLRHITIAYGMYGSDYYKDPEVLKTIIFCLDWMYLHAYGEDMIEGHGWRDPKLPNWWYMYIGAPEHLADILLILHEEISLEDRRRYLKCFEWIATWMCTGPQWRMTRIKICTEYGVLLHKPEYLIQEAEDFDAKLQVTRMDYLDYSHSYPHNMSYGGLFYSRFVYVSSALSGTALEYNSPNSYKQFLRLKYMYEPAMYKGQAFYMLAGRHTAQMVESTKAVEFLSYLLSLLGVWGEDEDAYIKQFLKRHSINPLFKERMLKSASLIELEKYEEILADDTIPYEFDYELAYSWYTGDRAAQHRNNYAFGIAMASKRHINYESILHQNPNGWYSGDGAFHLYTSYDSEQYDGDNFIKNMNIAYRFPGTTEDMQPRVARGIGYGAWKAPNSFAGSIEIDNSYIAAGMEFISEFCEQEDTTYDEVRGYGRAEHHNDLTCKKAWFCFDKEAVLLGAGITSTMNSPVNTIVAHRRIVNDDALSQFVKCGEYEKLEKCEFEKRYKNPEYILWEGHTGYVFLENSDVYVGRYNYTTNEEQPYLEVRVEHGANPTGGSYAYAVIPYADKATLEAYANNPEITILENSSKLQAVSKKELGVSGYVFYEKGSFGSIEVDTGAIIMTKETNDTYEVSICDATQECEEITVRINAPYKLTYKDNGVTVSEIDGGIEIKVGTVGAMGKPFRVGFHISA